MRTTAFLGAFAVVVSIGGPAISAPVTNWSGIYVGANGGCGQFTQTITNFNVTDEPDTSNFTGDYTLAPNGCFGGVQGAVNFQSRNLVWGAVGDIDWGSLSGSGTITEDSDGSLEPVPYTSKLHSFGTLRGRVGLATGELLPYVTAGLAWANNTVSADGHTSTMTHVGWAAGAGFELAVSHGWTLGAEYLYTNLGSRNYAVNFDDEASPGADIGLTAQLFKVSLNYRLFGGP